MERDMNSDVNNENKEKPINPANGRAMFIAGDKIRTATLNDLSNLIDVVGMTSDDPLWKNYRSFDFNNNGVIDVYDISTLAKFIP